MATVDRDSRNVVAGEPQVRLDDDGVIAIDFSGCSRITLAIVEQANRLHRELRPDRAGPLLMQGERVGRIDYAAQRYASSPAVCALTTALAIVARGFLPRHLARMFLMYHRPPYPTQVFADEHTARDWLLRQDKQHE